MNQVVVIDNAVGVFCFFRFPFAVQYESPGLTLTAFVLTSEVIIWPLCLCFYLVSTSAAPICIRLRPVQKYHHPAHAGSAHCTLEGPLTLPLCPGPSHSLPPRLGLSLSHNSDHR